MRPLRVVHVGLGPVGLGVAKAASRAPAIESVAAVDPAFAGRDLGDMLGATQPGLSVSPDLDAALRTCRADIALHCTGSRLAQVEPQLHELIERGLSVVSTTEELSWPWFHHPAEARRLDAAAKAAGVRVLGTGVNPGFVMDLLPVFMRTVMLTIHAVRIERVLNASLRRKPLQVKIGAGLAPAEFRSRASQGTLGHMGLLESVAMIGAGLDWELDAIDQVIDPVIAAHQIRTDAVEVSSGQVRGLHQVATGSVRGERKITLDLTMALEADNPGDMVLLEGVPDLKLEILGGIPGDVATAASVVNALRRLPSARPGLVTVLDLPSAASDLTDAR